MRFDTLPLSSTACAILPAISVNQTEMPKKKKVAPERLAATRSITNTFNIFPQSEPADDEAEPLPPEVCPSTSMPHDIS